MLSHLLEYRQYCLSCIAAVLFFFIAAPALADNVGITKARLIQTTEKSYVIEADVTQALSWAIKAPIFPDRFQVSELEYITQTGWIIVQATATTEGEPLNPADEILLPWMRNGAAISVQWLDGTVQQGLFMRSLEGIRVPLNLLMIQTRSLSEVSSEHFFIGLNHLSFKWIHLLLACVLGLLLPGRQIFKPLLFYTFGQFFSLILVDFGLIGFDLLFTDFLGVIIIFLVACGIARQRPVKEYLPLLFVFGLLHGLAYGREMILMNIRSDHKVPALFMFNLALDVCQFVTAGLLAALVSCMRRAERVKQIGNYAVGTLSVALVCILFQDHVMAGRTDILNLAPEQLATQYTLPPAQNNQGSTSRPRGARQLSNPVMAYLSAEPFEVRQEILVQARAAVRFLGVDDTGMGSIPVESLEPIKKGLLKVFQKGNTMTIDGESAEPVLAKADFVTLSPAGVMILPEPVEQSLDNGIIGLTLVYETSDLADAIEINWRLFSKYVPRIEATITDPFGGATMVLSRDDNVLQWKSRLSGYQVPVIEEIAVESRKLPIVTLIIFILTFLLFLLSLKRQWKIVGEPVLLSFVGLGFILYPFVRFPMEAPFIPQWKPSTERTAEIMDGLLTSVYRSFDVRNESDVYDRLALSVIGDKLTEIYLENRQSLELENRGGARANVDEVEILEVRNVRALKDNIGFTVDAEWTVSGSVNHFGHTHYRRNRYHASVACVTDDDSWKIQDVELIDEERIL